MVKVPVGASREGVCTGPEFFYEYLTGISPIFCNNLKKGLKVAWIGFFLFIDGNAGVDIPGSDNRIEE